MEGSNEGKKGRKEIRGAGGNEESFQFIDQAKSRPKSSTIN